MTPSLSLTLPLHSRQAEKSDRCWRDLIAVCDAASHALHLASQDVREPELARVLRDVVALHRIFLDELRAFALRQGRDLVKPESASVAALIGRGWGNFRFALASRDTRAILAGCARREDETVEAFRMAQRTLTDPEERAVVGEHLLQVQVAQEIVHELRSAEERS